MLVCRGRFEVKVSFFDLTATGRFKMQRFQTFAIFAATLLCFAGTALAADYVVQIGALRIPDASFSKPADEVGTVATSKNKDGLTRYRVGVYASKDEASAALRSLQSVGYTDAYVVLVGRVASAKITKRSRAGTPIGEAVDLSMLSQLPEEVRIRVVYLDNVLHLKDEGRFTPLREYLDSKLPAVSAGPPESLK